VDGTVKLVILSKVSVVDEVCTVELVPPSIFTDIVVVAVEFAFQAETYTFNDDTGLVDDCTNLKVFSRVAVVAVVEN